MTSSSFSNFNRRLKLRLLDTNGFSESLHPEGLSEVSLIIQGQQKNLLEAFKLPYMAEFNVLDLKEEEKCIQCRCLWLDPVMDTTSKHLYCSGNCAHWVPIGYRNVGFATMPECLTQSYYQSRSVQCRVCQQDCRIGANLSGLLRHVLEDCRFPCPNAGCTVKVSLREIINHAQECTSALVDCPYATLLKQENLTKMPIVQCEFRGRRNEMDSHLQANSCAKYLDMVECLKSRFSANETVENSSNSVPEVRVNPPLIVQATLLESVTQTPQIIQATLLEPILPRTASAALEPIVEPKATPALETITTVQSKRREHYICKYTDQAEHLTFEMDILRRSKSEQWYVRESDFIRPILGALPATQRIAKRDNFINANDVKYVAKLYVQVDRTSVRKAERFYLTAAGVDQWLEHGWNEPSLLNHPYKHWVRNTLLPTMVSGSRAIANANPRDTEKKSDEKLEDKMNSAEALCSIAIKSDKKVRRRERRPAEILVRKRRKLCKNSNHCTPTDLTKMIGKVLLAIYSDPSTRYSINRFTVSQLKVHIKSKMSLAEQAIWNNFELWNPKIAHREFRRALTNSHYESPLDQPLCHVREKYWIKGKDPDTDEFYTHGWPMDVQMEEDESENSETESDEDAVEGKYAEHEIAEASDNDVYDSRMFSDCVS